MNKFLVLLTISLALFSCGESDPMMVGPEVNTGSIIDIQAERATSGGSTSAFDIAETGVCWSTSANPTIADNHTEEGPGTNTGNDGWISTLTDLTPSTEYHVRAYATNGSGETGYGRDETFTTADEPVISCTPDENSIIFNNQVQTFSSINAGADEALYGNYGIRGLGPQSDITIDFYGPPVTAEYRVVQPSTGLDNNPFSCKISGTFSGVSIWQSKSGTAFVEKLGEDKYTITFCDVEFISASVSFSVENNHGNLVVD